MIIYADILFLLNAFISYICLLCTAFILKIPFRRLRLLIAALVGGASAFLLLIKMPIYLGFPLKSAGCVLIILCAFKRERFRLFLMQIMLFLVMNALIGGIVFALSFADRKDFYSNIMYCYINVSPLVLTLSLSICYVCVALLTSFFRKRAHRHEIYRVKLFVADEVIHCFGFSDSGNHLCEPFSGMPVCIIKPGFIKNFDNIEAKRIIPFASVGGEGLLEGVRVKMQIDAHRERFMCESYVAQSAAAFQGLSFDIILNEKLFEMEREHEITSFSKRT